MPIRIRSQRGVNRAQANELLLDAPTIAARFPLDPSVLAALAEAEHDVGNQKEGDEDHSLIATIRQRAARKPLAFPYPALTVLHILQPAHNARLLGGLRGVLLGGLFRLGFTDFLARFLL
jgi:hypothetical protein